ncbi:hypothetical protein CEXT_28501 [Caerostris extrusa]|uniref:Uncharacterized protein n=1 Tax=Caerostris extrusa TaxID=172846 RepID=A0AAV4PT72_CAEEX|nr:hypothetical protein CEXT_28501 [Caerostris extrusa]
MSLFLQVITVVEESENLGVEEKSTSFTRYRIAEEYLSLMRLQWNDIIHSFSFYAYPLCDFFHPSLSSVCTPSIRKRLSSREKPLTELNKFFSNHKDKAIRSCVIVSATLRAPHANRETSKGFKNIA